MTTLTLHPIQKGWPNDNGSDYMDIWELHPEHLSWLLRHEYKFMRQEGASRRLARWHVHRMIAMIWGPLGWTASPVDDPRDDCVEMLVDAHGYDEEGAQAAIDAMVLEGETIATIYRRLRGTRSTRLNDSTAMNAIHGVMTGTEWSADTLDEIALLVTATGRTIANSDEFEEEA